MTCELCDAVNGRGYILLDVLGEILHWGGQLVVSYVLVGLAYGWTLSSRAVQKYIPDDKVRATDCKGTYATFLVVQYRVPGCCSRWVRLLFVSRHVSAQLKA